jgi:hypothetical protein
VIAIICKDRDEETVFVDIETNLIWFLSNPKEYKRGRLNVHCLATNEFGIANVELIQEQPDGKKMCWIYKIYFPDEVELEVDDVI